METSDFVRLSYPTVAFLTVGLASVVSTASGQTQGMLGGAVIDPGWPQGASAALLYATGDYNNDGIKDLLLNSGDIEPIWVSLGHADGSFVAQGPFVPNSRFVSVAAGQIDDDDGVEVVYRERLSFSSEIVMIADPGAEPETIEVEGIAYDDPDPFGDDAFRAYTMVGDLDADGRSELVFNTTGKRVVVRWSSRDPQLAFESYEDADLSVQNVLYPIDDYDGDALPDVLLFDRDNAQFVLFSGTGTDTLSQPRFIDAPYPSIVDDNRPVFGQFDADPAIDVVIHSRSEQSMRVVLNFTNPDALSVPVNAGVFAVPMLAPGDLDADGQPDLVVMRSGDFLASVQSNFEPGILSDLLGANPEVLEISAGAPFSELYTGGPVPIDDAMAGRVDSIDFDLDGDQDLLWLGVLASGSRAAISVNRSGEAGVPLFGADRLDLPSGPVHVLAVDLDSDGRDEALVAGSSHLRIIDPDTGDSTIVPASSGSFMTVLADLDGDGTNEIVKSNTTGKGLRAYTIVGDGTISPLAIPQFKGVGDTYGLEVADFDADGRDDIAATDFDKGAVVVFRGIDGPSLEYWGQTPALEQGSMVKAAAIDFNHDNRPDLAVGYIDEDQILLYANNGDGTFTESGVIASHMPYWLIGDDLDDDGITDLAAVDNDRLLSVHFLDASGQASESIHLPVTSRAVEVVSADFDNDGRTDLAVSSSILSSQTMRSPTIWRQTGPRVFSVAAALPGPDSTGLTVADMNDDGVPDLLSVSDTDRKLRVHYGDPAPCPADLTGDGQLNFFDVSTFLVSFNAQDPQGDYNADGSFDFFDVSGFLVDFNAGCP